MCMYIYRMCIVWHKNITQSCHYSHPQIWYKTCKLVCLVLLNIMWHANKHQSWFTIAQRGSWVTSLFLLWLCHLPKPFRHISHWFIYLLSEPVIKFLHFISHYNIHKKSGHLPNSFINLQFSSASQTTPFHYVLCPDKLHVYCMTPQSCTDGSCMTAIFRAAICCVNQE